MRKHFKEAHGIAIDEACKNLSRLCYVAHDPDAFIRSEDAKLLEPLPEERPEAPKKGRGKSGPRRLDVFAEIGIHHLQRKRRDNLQAHFGTQPARNVYP